MENGKLSRLQKKGKSNRILYILHTYYIHIQFVFGRVEWQRSGKHGLNVIKFSRSSFSMSLVSSLCTFYYISHCIILSCGRTHYSLHTAKVLQNLSLSLSYFPKKIHMKTNDKVSQTQRESHCGSRYIRIYIHRYKHTHTHKIIISTISSSQHHPSFHPLM